MDLLSNISIEGLTCIEWVGGDYESCKKHDRIWVIGENESYYEVYLNIHEILFPGELINPQKIFNRTAFYGFLQNFNNNNNYITDEDYKKVWNIFLQLLSVFNPGICLFLWSDALSFFKETLIGSGFIIVKEETNLNNDELPNRSFVIADKSGNQYTLLFFEFKKVHSKQKLNEFLQLKMGGQINSLREFALR